MTYVLYALVAISALVLTISVAATEGDDQGLQALGGAESIWGSKNPTRNVLLKRITTVSTVVFMVTTLILAAL